MITTRRNLTEHVSDHTFYEKRRSLVNQLGFLDLGQLEESTERQGGTPITLSHIQENYVPLIIRQDIAYRDDYGAIRLKETNEIWFGTLNDLGYDIGTSEDSGAYSKNYIIHADFVSFLNNYRDFENNLPADFVLVSKFLMNYCSERGIEIPYATINSAMRQNQFGEMIKGMHRLTAAREDLLTEYAERYVQETMAKEKGLLDPANLIRYMEARGLKLNQKILSDSLKNGIIMVPSIVITKRKDRVFVFADPQEVFQFLISNPDRFKDGFRQALYGYLKRQEAA